MRTFHVNILFIQIHHPKVRHWSRPGCKPICTDSHTLCTVLWLKITCHWGLPVVTFMLGMERFCRIFNNTFCPLLFGRFVILGLCSNRTGLRLAHVHVTCFADASVSLMAGLSVRTASHTAGWCVELQWNYLPASFPLPRPRGWKSCSWKHLLLAPSSCWAENEKR